MDTLKVLLTYPATEKMKETETTEENTETDANQETSENTGEKSDGTQAGSTSGANQSGNGSGQSAASGGGAGSSPSETVSSTKTSGTGSTTETTANGSSSASSSNDDSLQETTGLTVIPQDQMILNVSVDELDILSIAEGQSAAITLDALEGETFQGTISSIATTATSSGGVSKYQVEVTLPKSSSMLAGMSASATITIEEKSDILMIPLDALQEMDGKSFVYTEKSAGTLGGQVEVETGLSDSGNVEIVSGLSEGQSVYYQVIESSNSSSSEGMNMMGGPGGFSMDSGNMPSGNMPSGDRPDGGSMGGSGMGGSGGPSGSSKGGE